MKKRGRPKQYLQDTVINKKTEMEFLDALLYNNILTQEEHSYGMRYKWLFILKHGLPSITANKMDKLYSKKHKKYDENFMKVCEKEYKSIVLNLIKTETYKIVTDICIYNIAPSFYTKNAKQNFDVIMFKNGLDAIAEVYKD